MHSKLTLLLAFGYFCYNFAQGVTVQKITNSLLLGEGPHWNAQTQLLYFVDITNCTIHTYEPKTGAHHYTRVEGGPVSFIIPIAGTNDEFLVSTGLDIRHIVWDGQTDSKLTSSRIIYSALQKSDGSRFNDAKVDMFGTLWAGTMGPEDVPNIITKKTGKLYRISPNLGISIQLTNILISNGLAWSIGSDFMYYTDTGNNTIDCYDFNPISQYPLSNKMVVFNFTKEGIKGKTDGFTIDTNGNLWLASYGGNEIIAINPKNKTLIARIPIEAIQVTSLTWGGENLDELYVTTGRKALTDDELQQYPNSGATFKITDLNARGYPGQNYVMYNNCN